MVGDDLGCADPGSFKNADGTPLFQRIKRPTWTPNYAWTYITVVTL
jgi:hypothetical protein